MTSYVVVARILNKRHIRDDRFVIWKQDEGRREENLKANPTIIQIYLSHNKMSPSAMILFSEGLESNTKLTDLFFTHNDL